MLLLFEKKNSTINKANNDISDYDMNSVNLIHISEYLSSGEMSDGSTDSNIIMVDNNFHFNDSSASDKEFSIKSKQIRIMNRYNECFII